MKYYTEIEVRELLRVQRSICADKYEEIYGDDANIGDIIAHVNEPDLSQPIANLPLEDKTLDDIINNAAFHLRESAISEEITISNAIKEYINAVNNHSLKGTKI